MSSRGLSDSSWQGSDPQVLLCTGVADCEDVCICSGLMIPRDGMTGVFTKAKPVCQDTKFSGVRSQPFRG
jgi:hypothetical protein